MNTYRPRSHRKSFLEKLFTSPRDQGFMDAPSSTCSFSAYAVIGLFLRGRRLCGQKGGSDYILITPAHILFHAIGDIIVSFNPVVEGRRYYARRVETQVRFITRMLVVLIVIIGLGSALMTFPSVKQIGTSLLASAGIGGLIVGFAARPVLSNLLAGLQIALSQPFRIEDVLNVKGEWCRVEEVTATYVVLRVWDQRRLVVPLNYFIENSFENWTRNNSDLFGTVFLWVDYRMPLEPLREEFTRLLNEAEEWDREINLVQVTGSGERAMQVRFLMSGRDSVSLWNLRCRIREDLVAFVQSNYPEYLPIIRARLQDMTDETDSLDPTQENTAERRSS